MPLFLVRAQAVPRPPSLAGQGLFSWPRTWGLALLLTGRAVVYYLDLLYDFWRTSHRALLDAQGSPGRQAGRLRAAPFVGRKPSDRVRVHICLAWPRPCCFLSTLALPFLRLCAQPLLVLCARQAFWSLGQNLLAYYALSAFFFFSDYKINTYSWL